MWRLGGDTLTYLGATDCDGWYGARYGGIGVESCSIWGESICFRCDRWFPLPTVGEDDSAFGCLFWVLVDDSSIGCYE